MAAAPCARLRLVRGPVWKSSRGRPFNGIVRKHFGMTGETPTASHRSTLGALFGTVLIVVAMFVGLPVAVNLPESWPGAVLSLSMGAIGIALVITHLVQVRRARQEEMRNAS